MTLIHTLILPIRYDECDLYGHVNHVNYLRYMQEAAFAASAAVGYSVPSYAEMGRAWLVRETSIEYLAPLRYGDSVEVRTWVEDFRRVRSRRAYELRRAGTADVVARGYSDWVYTDTEKQCPVTVPQEMIEAFWPGGKRDKSLSRDRFPQAPDPPPGKYSHRHSVRWSEIDPAQHVNNAEYLGYLEDCAVRDAASRGWPMTRMLQEGGFAIVARSYRILYLQQAFLGDELEVSTWISDVRRTSAIRHYTIHRVSDGELLTRARALWVWIDPESGRPKRIPRQFASDFAANIV
jgi:acyl-CoA thioester hydrolase